MRDREKSDNFPSCDSDGEGKKKNFNKLIFCQANSI